MPFNKIMLLLTLIPLILEQNCFYIYFYDRREICVENKLEIDSLDKVFLSFFYNGKQVKTLYRSDRMLSDKIVEKLAFKYFEKKETKDSLKKEGIYFKQLETSGGWTKKLETKCLHVDDEQIVKIDSVWDYFNYDSLYGGSQMILSILKNGKTTINLNCNKKSLKINIEIFNDSINAEGEKKIKFEHKKSIFRYFLCQ